MRERKGMSFLKIAPRLRLTPDRVRGPYDRYCHGLTIELIRRRAGGEKSHRELFAYCRGRYATPKKRYKVLLRDKSDCGGPPGGE